MGFEGGPCKKNGFKGGGAAKKIWGVKGGVTKKMALKFLSDSVCNNANNSARRPKIAFLSF